MSDESIFEARRILNDIFDEFVKEEKRISDICNSHSVRIDELEQKIRNLRKNEDIDFKVFSPRSMSNENSDKITALEKEKESLEIENRNFSKQFNYYSDKASKLNNVLSLLGEHRSDDNSGPDVFVDLPDKVEPEIKKDFFDDLFPDFREPENDNIVKDSSDNSVKPSDLVDDDLTLSDSDITEDSSRADISVNKSDQENLKFQNDINSIIHKAEFTEKIIVNDSIRARFEIREIIKLLKDFLN